MQALFRSFTLSASDTWAANAVAEGRNTVGRDIVAAGALSMENVKLPVGTVARCCRSGRVFDAPFEDSASVIAAAGRSVPEGLVSGIGD